MIKISRETYDLMVSTIEEDFFNMDESMEIIPIPIPYEEGEECFAIWDYDGGGIKGHLWTYGTYCFISSEIPQFIHTRYKLYQNFLDKGYLKDDEDRLQILENLDKLDWAIDKALDEINS